MNSSGTFASPHSGCGNYRDDIADLMRAFYEEVDDSVLRELMSESIMEVRNIRFRDILAITKPQDLYVLILQDNGNNYKQLILSMNRMMSIVVKDLSTELKNKMKAFTQRLTREQLDLKLGEEGELYGRAEELGRLIGLIIKTHIKFVDVWGSPGIGKSYLIKTLASKVYNETPCCVEYTDCRGMKTLGQLLTHILIKLRKTGSIPVSDTSELLGLWLLHLERKYQDNGCLIILDNLSDMLVDVSSSERLFHFVIETLSYLESKKMQVTIVVTSTTHLTASTGGFHSQLLSEYRQTLRPWSADVKVNNLALEDSKQFLDFKSQEVSKELQRLALELCQYGHPFSLYLLGILVSRDLQAAHLLLRNLPQANPTEWIYRTLSTTFTELTIEQQKILFAVALFSGEAQLQAIHQIVSRSEVNGFCERVQKDFNTGFWLSFSTSDKVTESRRKTVVRCSHFMVRQFLLDTISSLDKIKEAFICHNIGTLVYFGKHCMDNPQQSCELLMRNKSNIAQAFQIICTGFGNPQLLYTKFKEKANLSDSCLTEMTTEDIGHLFLCVHQHINFFEEYLTKALEYLLTLKDGVNCQYLWSLYRLVLTTERRWDQLDSTIQTHNRNSLCYISHFCKAINTYTEATLLLNTKDIKDSRICTQFYELLFCSLKELKWEADKKEAGILSTSVNKYFAVHIRLLLISVAERSQVQPKHSVVELCRSVKKDVKYTPILTPLVAATIYPLAATQSASNKPVRGYKAALEYYGKSDQLDLLPAADCMINITKLHLEQQGSIEEGKKYGAQAISIIERNSVLTPLKDVLFRGLVLMADCYHRVAVLYRQTRELDKEKMSLNQALSNYKRAYNLVQRSPTSCALWKAENKKYLDKLHEGLPYLLSYSNHRLSSETMQAVVANLELVSTEAAHNRSAPLPGDSLLVNSEEEVALPQKSLPFPEATTTSVQTAAVTPSPISKEYQPPEQPMDTESEATDRKIPRLG